MILLVQPQQQRPGAGAGGQRAGGAGARASGQGQGQGHQGAASAVMARRPDGTLVNPAAAIQAMKVRKKCDHLVWVCGRVKWGWREDCAGFGAAARWEHGTLVNPAAAIQAMVVGGRGMVEGWT